MARDTISSAGAETQGRKKGFCLHKTVGSAAKDTDVVKSLWSSEETSLSLSWGPPACEELVGRHQPAQGGGQVGDQGDKLAGTQVSRVRSLVLHSIFSINSLVRGGVRNVRLVMNIVFNHCIFKHFLEPENKDVNSRDTL